MTTRHVAAALGVIKAEGFTVDEVRYGKHLVVKASHPSGLRRVFCTSFTPSDFRTLRNFRSEIRRALKGSET